MKPTKILLIIICTISIFAATSSSAPDNKKEQEDTVSGFVINDFIADECPGNNLNNISASRIGVSRSYSCKPGCIYKSFTINIGIFDDYLSAHSAFITAIGKITIAPISSKTFIGDETYVWGGTVLFREKNAFVWVVTSSEQDETSAAIALAQKIDEKLKHSIVKNSTFMRSKAELKNNWNKINLKSKRKKKIFIDILGKSDLNNLIYDTDIRALGLGNGVLKKSNGKISIDYYPDLIIIKDKKSVAFNLIVADKNNYIFTVPIVIELEE